MGRLLPKAVAQKGTIQRKAVESILHPAACVQEISYSRPSSYSVSARPSKRPSPHNTLVHDKTRGCGIAREIKSEIDWVTLKKGDVELQVIFERLAIISPTAREPCTMQCANWQGLACNSIASAVWTLPIHRRYRKDAMTEQWKIAASGRGGEHPQRGTLFQHEGGLAQALTQGDWHLALIGISLSPEYLSNLGFPHHVLPKEASTSNQPLSRPQNPPPISDTPSGGGSTAAARCDHTSLATETSPLGISRHACANRTTTVQYIAKWHFPSRPWNPQPSARASISEQQPRLTSSPSASRRVTLPGLRRASAARHAATSISSTNGNAKVRSRILGQRCSPRASSCAAVSANQTLDMTTSIHFATTPTSRCARDSPTWTDYAPREAAAVWAYSQASTSPGQERPRRNCEPRHRGVLLARILRLGEVDAGQSGGAADMHACQYLSLRGVDDRGKVGGVLVLSWLVRSNAVMWGGHIVAPLKRLS
ncbi:hypothetical protein OPT61_g1056 [Boeremia exigua]|uniref:Uncharacterized protein n=1 Tax=Boeremia exigua TaxID=749465 RepID=A0ACC2IRQ4_9PLEO|nr:hypothetical protein OPT61_g1056 [Boeremia exigua]